MSEYFGCSDGNCIFGHPGGLHTNGGCRCLRDLDVDHERRQRVRNGIKALRAEVAKLRAHAQIFAEHGLRVDDSSRFDEWWEKHARFAELNQRKACRAAYDFGRGVIDIEGEVVEQEAAR